jgi:ABC-2 type transport system permease protein
LAIVAVALLSIFFIVTGLGLRMIGVAPTADEIMRLLIFLVISIIYVGFWLALSTLFSIVTRHAATSVLGSLAVWLFMAIMWTILAIFVAGIAYPTNDNSPPQQVLDHVNFQQNVSRVSPATLYSEATSAILDPELRTTSGVVMLSEAQGMVPGTLSLNQSLLLVWPDLTATIALTAVCFGAAYYTFLRQEIRTL